MSETVLESRIGSLIVHLEQIGRPVDGQDGLWPEQIAEILWLAHQIPDSSTAQITALDTRPMQPDKPGPPAEEIPVDESSGQQPTEDQGAGSAPEKGPSLEEPTLPTISRRLGGQPAAKQPEDVFNYYRAQVTHTQPVTLLLSRPVRQRSKLTRSIRPLLRRVPSRTAVTLDISATVEQIAISRTPLVVLRPAREHRYDLTLVIDAQARSLNLWQDWIADFRQFISSQGAFRHVTIWSIHDDTRVKLNQGRPYLTVGLPDPTGSQHGASHPRRQVNEVLDPTQRRLIMVVSDFVGAAWQPERLPVTLANWGRQNLVTLLHLLPERLWEQSQLKIRRWATSYQPLATSRDLAILPNPNQAYGATLAPELTEYVPVPITTALAPEQVATWARTLIGLATQQIRVTLFNPASPQTASEAQKLAATAEQQPKPAITQDLATQQRKRAEDWLRRATITSRRLAKRLALAGPLELPMMRLIQQRLPASDEGHLADLFLSRLIERIDGGKRPLYAFPQPIAHIIQNDNTGEDGRFRVAVDIAEYYGIDVRAFLEYGELPDLSDDQARRNNVLPFLSILQDELSQHGPIFEKHTAAIQQLLNDRLWDELKGYRQGSLLGLLVWLQQTIDSESQAEIVEQLQAELAEALERAANQLAQHAQKQIENADAQRSQALDTLDPTPLATLIGTYEHIMQMLTHADLLELEPPDPSPETPAQSLNPEIQPIIERLRARLRTIPLLATTITQYEDALRDLRALQEKVARLAGRLAEAEEAIDVGNDQIASHILIEIQNELTPKQSSRIEQALLRLKKQHQREELRAYFDNLITARQLENEADALIMLRKLIAQGVTIGAEGEDLAINLANRRNLFVKKLLRVAEEEASQALIAHNDGLEFLDGRKFAAAVDHYTRALEILDNPTLTPESPALTESDHATRDAISYLRDQIRELPEVVPARDRYRQRQQRTAYLHELSPDLARRYQEADQAFAASRFEQARNRLRLIAAMIEPDTSTRIESMLTLIAERLAEQGPLQALDLLSQARQRMVEGDLEGAQRNIGQILGPSLDSPMMAELREEARRLSERLEADRRAIADLHKALYSSSSTLANYDHHFANLDGLIERQSQSAELRRLERDVLYAAVNLASYEASSTIVSADQAALQALEHRLTSLTNRLAALPDEPPGSARRHNLSSALARVQAAHGIMPGPRMV